MFEYNVTYREKDGGWQYIISFKDQNGKWKQRSKQGFSRKSIAKKAAEKRAEELKKMFTLQKNNDFKELTFETCSEMFLSHVELYREYNTSKGYRQAIQKFADLNNLEMTRITNMHIQSCIDNMVKEGLSPTTIENYVVIIKTFFNNAVKQQRIISENPITSLAIPKRKEKEKVKALAKSQLDELLDKLPYDKYYIMSLIAAKSGLRIGEIVGLMWQDIDFFKGTIRVSRQWKKLKDGSWGFGSVKGEKSDRTVPAPQDLLKELKKYKKNSPASIDGRLFPVRRTATASAISQRRYKEAGFDISIHDLRHTYATLLLSNGVDFETVAKLMGHNVEETIRTYSHVTDDMIERAKKIINNIF